MPLYDYACAAGCGPFRAWSTMAEAAAPGSCPCCGGRGERQLATPHLATMNGKLRQAMDRAERSSAEPRVAPRRHLERCGCSLCAARPRRPPSVARRWTVGHG